METTWYVLAGGARRRHVRLRLPRRGQADEPPPGRRAVTGPELRRQLERQGIAMRGASARGLAEEATQATRTSTRSSRQPRPKLRAPAEANADGGRGPAADPGGRGGQPERAGGQGQRREDLPGPGELQDRFFDLVLVVVADRGNQPPHQPPDRPVPSENSTRARVNSARVLMSSSLGVKPRTASGPWVSSSPASTNVIGAVTSNRSSRADSAPQPNTSAATMARSATLTVSRVRRGRHQPGGEAATASVRPASTGPPACHPGPRRPCAAAGSGGACRRRRRPGRSGTGRARRPTGARTARWCRGAAGTCSVRPRPR